MDKVIKMDKNGAIAKAKEMMSYLTSHKWKDLTRRSQVEKRLIGIAEFVSYSYFISAKEWDDLNRHLETCLNNWNK